MFRACDIARDRGQATANWWGMRAGDTGKLPLPWPMSLRLLADGAFNGAAIVMHGTMRGDVRLSEPGQVKLGWSRELSLSIEGGDAETDIRIRVDADHGRAAEKVRHHTDKYRVA